jgi:hypothetical protein
MVDLGSSGAPNVTPVSRNALLSVVSVAHTENCVPIAPEATDGALVGPNITK